MASADDYGWLEDYFDDAACLTVVVGKDEAAVLHDLGADRTATVAMGDAVSFDEDEEGSNGPSFVSVIAVPGGVLAVEFNGYQGSLSEVVAALSSGGRAASMFWNVNDDNAFTCARQGELVATVDMYDAEEPDSVDLPDELMTLFASAEDGDADLHALGLAMVEQFTGIRITPEQIASLDAAYPVPGTRCVSLGRDQRPGHDRAGRDRLR